MARLPLRFLRVSVCVVAVVALLAVTHTLWLTGLGNLLVRDDGPTRADIAVVLAGDLSGSRILRSAELVKQGYVPLVLVSGPDLIYGRHECDFEVPYAVEHGYPAAWFVCAPNRARSTKEEAAVILADLRRRAVHRFLLVTSNYHSRRAARIYHAAAPDLEMRVVAAPDEYFQADGWWRNREGQKTFFMEWSKTVASVVGL